MESVIERITRGRFWQFHGGIHPPEQKFFTCNKPIATIALPKQFTLPLRQHIGQAGELLVKVGDKVLKGQALTKSVNPMSVPIHAPTSGTITDIATSMIPHPSGLSEPCIKLTADGNETWIERQICPNYLQLSKEQLVEKIANAGIAGMGGAGFPTQVKVGTVAKIETLIINAAECEPYITADDLLIQEHCPTIIDGIRILEHLFAPDNILIGIEDNKPEAIKVLKKATENLHQIHICVIPTKYPSGGEKQLIKILTGQEVPRGVLPSAIGIAMQNVATCYAIADAVINDTPLIKRVVTVTGQALEKPQNLWAPLGTAIADLVSTCGYKNGQNKHLIMGGPMMGFSLPSDKLPIIKTTNCILAPSEIEIASPYSSTSSKEVECIRCGQCADACPAQLLPQELQWSAKAKDQQQLEVLNLFDCIECGACAYVCPSQIPLVHYYRVAKAEIRQQKLLDLKAERAKVRFEARKKRLEQEKIARAEKHRKAAEARKARMNADNPEAKAEKSAVAAALARVKAKKAQAAPVEADTVLSEKSQVANAIARAKAKKLAQKAAQAETAKAVPATEGKSDKVASAIAKAKAKKEAIPNKESDEIQVSTNSDAVSDKKSKVAAAIAKAKAKKLAANAGQAPSAAQSPTLDVETAIPAAKTDTLTQTIDKKSKVAAAVAKAKAKKIAAQQQLEQGVVQPKAAKPSEAADSKNVNDAELSSAADKKAKVAAAVAKAKARKLAAQKHVIQDEIQTAPAKPVITTEDKNASNTEQSPASDKKAKIAAAIAKAKAKKLAAQKNKQVTKE